MSDFPGARSPRPADPHPRLRLAALTAVITGVVLLAAAAFVVSYSGIHQIALETGVTTMLAKLYPLMFDATLVIACAAALALRGAGWWMRLYVWLSLLLLLGVAAAGDAVQAMGIALPRQPSRAVVAVIPWLLLLLAFGLWLAMLRQLRRIRTAGGAANRASRQQGRGASDSVDGNGTTGGGATVTWAAGTGPSRAGIGTLMEPRTGQPPAVAPPTRAGQAVHPPGEPPSVVSPGSRPEGPAGAGTGAGEPAEGTHAETEGAHAETEGAHAEGEQAGDGQAEEEQGRGEGPGDEQAHDELPGDTRAEGEQAGDSRPGAGESPHTSTPTADAPFERLQSSPTPPQE